MDGVGSGIVQVPRSGVIVVVVMMNRIESNNNKNRTYLNS